MTVRPAVDADLDAVFALERSLATAPHWPRASYRTDSAGWALRVAEAGGMLIGFCAASHVAGVAAELESVAVDRAWQGRGVGYALCGSALAWFAAQGAGAIELEVRAGSQGAVRLYRRLGFVETGRRPRYYNDPVEDALRMRRELLPGTPQGEV